MPPIHTANEIELWMAHIAPRMNKPVQCIEAGRRNWHCAMAERGLTDAHSTAVEQFVRRPSRLKLVTLLQAPLGLNDRDIAWNDATSLSLTRRALLANSQYPLMVPIGHQRRCSRGPLCAANGTKRDVETSAHHPFRATGTKFLLERQTTVHDAGVWLHVAQFSPTDRVNLKSAPWGTAVAHIRPP
jgi:hypothetical protein